MESRWDLPATMTLPGPVSSLALSGSMAVAAGLVGSFALLRRMSLAADALSHVALPGIGLALVFRVQPFLGALVALIIGAVVIWSLESRTRLTTEAIIGVVFSSALALGAILTTGEELIDALFGVATKLSVVELTIGVLASLGVIVCVGLLKDRMTLALLSQDIALTAGIDVRRLELIYLLNLALTVALGLRYLGVLLMGSLLIIPAAAARQLARNLSTMLALSAIFALASTFIGTGVAAYLGRETGPFIVLVAALCFVGALLGSRGRAGV